MNSSDFNQCWTICKGCSIDHVCVWPVCGGICSREKERERAVGWGWLGVCAIVRTEGVSLGCDVRV